jgi:hypothetical protein
MIGHPVFCEIKPPEHLIMYSKKTLNTLLKKHSFDILQIEDTNGTTFGDLEYNNRVLRSMLPIFKPLLKLIPGDSEFIVVATKK